MVSVMCHQHHAETHLPSSPPQDSYLAPKFKQIVEYCRGGDSSVEGLLELLEEEAGELGSVFIDEGFNAVYLCYYFYY